MTAAAILVAAPRGGQPETVLLAPLAGRPVIAHALAALESAAGVDEIIVAAAPSVAPGIRALLAAGRHARVAAVVEGGSSAMDCARAAAEALGDAHRDVLVHDAARALAGRPAIEACAAALREHQAVCAVVPASDTMVAVSDGIITERPPRDRLRHRQTPQGFRLGLLRRGYRLAGADPASEPGDECEIVLRYLPAVPVHLVPGSEQAFSITTPAGAAVAEAILRAGRLSAASPA